MAEAECQRQQKGKKRNGLPPAGLADLDPSLGEQTKGQAQSRLKDNNTIQKVSMQHGTNGLFPSTAANAAVPRVLRLTHSTVSAFIPGLFVKHPSIMCQA